MPTSLASPYLARIDLYPIKSLDGVSVTQAAVLPSGALKCDRTYALFDNHGAVINAKRTAKINGVRSHFSDDLASITLWVEGSKDKATFHLDNPCPDLEAWFSDYFQQPVSVQENLDLGFPDDTASPGPTVISTATLEAVASWYPDLSLDEVRRRFRANLEIDGVPPFWEDHLFGAEDETVAFQVGEMTFLGVNPCQRCIVPTRNSITGEGTSQFQKTFNQQRLATLPEWVDRSRFNHFYRLSVNTRLAPSQSNSVLSVGDGVQIL
ncbi:MAG TPA: MOSC N-terminal beta barrel domain-containing protein [Trichocoleus sp.]